MKYPPETAKILHRDIFWFFLCDEDFVSKTINEGSVDLDKFPASKVYQLAKKYESSKATARHIKQVAGEMQATQIHLMRHQCTELSHGNTRNRSPRPSQGQCRTRMWNKSNQVNTRSPLIREVPTSKRTDAVSVEIQPT